MKNLRSLGLPFVLLVLGLSVVAVLDSRPARGAPPPLAVTLAPYKSAVTGTAIACNSGVSPCTVTNTAANVLSNNANRQGCFLEAVDVVDFYCKRATAAGSAASATNFDFILNAGSATKKSGGVWTCDSSGLVWTGPVNCIASASSAVVDIAVTETQ